MPPPVVAAARFGIRYRQAADSDLPFLAQLYASTRQQELAGLGWPKAMLDAFLDQQHAAQHRQFRAVYPDGEWLIVEQDRCAIGRVYLHQTADGVQLIDIALSEAVRGQGLGGAILEDLIGQAQDLGKPISCYVERSNEGAARLYRRLGFETVEDDGIYARMALNPAASGR